MRQREIGPDGARIRWVETVGEEPVRVYLPGLGLSSPACYGGVVTRPALAGRRSLLVDLLGFGISDRPAGFDHTLVSHADSIARLLDAEGIANAEVVGHSMGGTVATVLAYRRPDLVAALVLVDANLGPRPGARNMFTEFTEAEFVDHGFAGLAAQIDPEWWATLRLADPLAAHRAATGLAHGAGVSVATMLARLDTPCTFLRGGLDGPKPGAAELAAAGVRMVEVPGAGHHIMLDAPEAFAKVTAEAFGVREF